MLFTPKYINELIFPRKLGHRIATRQHISSLLHGLRLACKSILIKYVDLLNKHVDLSETCWSHWLDVLAELL